MLRDFKDYKKIYGEEHPKITRQREKLAAPREESNTLITDPKQHRELYKQDNDRANDLYNVAKRTGVLVNLDLTEYDRFTSDAIECVDGKTAGLNQMFKTKKVKKK